MRNEVWGFSDILPIEGSLQHRNKPRVNRASIKFQNHEEPASVSYRYNKTVSLVISIGDGYSRKL